MCLLGTNQREVTVSRMDNASFFCSTHDATANEDTDDYDDNYGNRGASNGAGVTRIGRR